MIQSLKMNTRAKKILSHYRGLRSTKWSEQEQAETRDAYKHNMNKKQNDNDERDAEIDYLSQMKHLSNKTE